jgi:hypothetical protein
MDWVFSSQPMWIGKSHWTSGRVVSSDPQASLHVTVQDCVTFLCEINVLIECMPEPDDEDNAGTQTHKLTKAELSVIPCKSCPKVIKIQVKANMKGLDLNMRASCCVSLKKLEEVQLNKSNEQKQKRKEHGQEQWPW